MNKKNSSLSKIENSDSEPEDLNTTHKSTKSQQNITKRQEISSKSYHPSKSPQKTTESSNSKEKTLDTSLTKKSKEISSKIKELEREDLENDIKFTSQPILLLNIDNDGKILINKKALQILKKITNYVNKEKILQSIINIRFQ